MKVTIITVCYNSEKYIEQTIKSVICQTYNDIEYIIVDGMSTDSTPQIIEKYQQHVSKYLRGKDKNMYDAINKGMAASTGDYIEILNSDDMLCNEHVIENVVGMIEKYQDKYDVFYGDNLILYQNLNLIKSRPKIQTSFKELLCSKKLTFVGHGTVFISRDVYENIGNYDCNHFKAAADLDFMLRALKSFKCMRLKTLVQTFRVHALSITSSGIIDKEIDEVLRKNGYFEVPYLLRACYYYKGWFRFWMTNFIPMLHFYVKKLGI